MELNNQNENLNTFKIRYEHRRRDETWTYIADSDTIQEKHLGLDGSIQTTIYKRYSSKELQRIKQRAKDVILGLYKNTIVEID